jgi:hypothetical protein
MHSGNQIHVLIVWLLMKGFTASRAQKQREEDYDAVASQQV